MTGHQHLRSTVARAISVVAIIVGSLIAAVALTSGALSVVFARTIVTPPTRRDEAVRILGYDATTITLSASIDAMTPGLYSLWFGQDTGHARIGEIITFSPSSVTRELLGVDLGSLAGVSRARVGGWFYLHPRDLGVPWSDVEIETELGRAPAWLIPAEEPSSSWVIAVHGRAVRREETLRAVPVFHDAGFTSLLISYRNDGDAPASADRRYTLGDTEWRDVEAAMEYAISHGAQQIVLMGWSMGGATVLQAATRSLLAPFVSGLVLESPVVDWITALHFQGIAHRLPRLVRLGAMSLLTRGWSRGLTGLRSPINLKRLDLAARAKELDLPILLLHSDDDGFVPSTASLSLATARPDIVTFDRFATARHTRLWNYDPDRWTASIAGWLRIVESAVEPAAEIS